MFGELVQDDDPTAKLEELLRRAADGASALDQNGIPRQRRNPEQIRDRAMQLADKLAGARPFDDGAAGREQLAKLGIDPTRLHQEINKIQIRASNEPTEPVLDTDVEGCGPPRRPSSYPRIMHL